MTTRTPKLGLSKPDPGQTYGWDTDLRHSLDVLDAAVGSEHDASGRHTHVHADRISVGAGSAHAAGEIACEVARIGGYALDGIRARQAVDGAAVAQQAAAQAQAADQQVQQLLAAMQQITVGGVAATVVPAPGNVPVADAQGHIDPGWLPEIFALTRVVAELARKQYEINQRLLAAGI